MSGKKRKDRITLNASRQSIKRRYEEGEKLAVIASDYGISTYTVRAIAVAEGAEARPVGRPMKAARA